MTVRHALVAATLGVCLLACGSDQPTEPDAFAKADPTPKPTATPTPAPAASSAPRASNCQVPAMPDHGACAKTSSRNEYRTAVNAVIDEIVAQRPDLFDRSQDAGGGSYLVTNRSAYMKQVLNRLGNRGFCVAEGQDEIGLKHINEFNEQWNVITSRGFIRRAYITTCTPAAF